MPYAASSRSSHDEAKRAGYVAGRAAGAMRRAFASRPCRSPWSHSSMTRPSTGRTTLAVRPVVSRSSWYSQMAPRRHTMLWCSSLACVEGAWAGRTGGW
eukprot:359416-Chlamydomonas_euryale.AAC.3